MTAYYNENNPCAAGWQGKARSVATRDYSDEEIEAVAQVMSPHLMVNGIKGRKELWEITGNAINLQLATQVIGALLDTLQQESTA